MQRPKFFVCNDENVKNSYGFYINTLGIKMDRFNDNPIMLNNHINTTENAIGNWSEPIKEGGLLKLKPHFDEESEPGLSIAKKVDKGILKGCSMGIIPNWDSMERMGDRMVLMECELAEVSMIPVPSNRGAIAIYSADGKLLTEDEVSNLTLSISNQFKSELNTNQIMKKITLSVGTLMALGFKDQPTDGLDVVDVEAKVLDLSARLTALTTENEALKLAAKTAKDAEEAAVKLAATQKVDLAITQGKIPADKKEAFVQLGITSPEVLEATLAAIPGKVNLGAGVKIPNEDGAATVATMDDFQKLSAEAQLSFKNDSPEEYKKLFS